MNKIVIGTRASELALAQADRVKKTLQQKYDLTIEIKEIITQGDKILDKPLAEIEGKGVFLKEIEKALISGEIDLAVHSLKDVPTELPAGLKIACYLNREDPRDVLVAPGYRGLTDLPAGSTVATGSLRRQAQLKQRRPDLKVASIRGNVNTRLAKLEKEDFQGLILAAAGLKRLELTEVISCYLSPYDFLPAPGQGALAIEIREEDQDIFELLKRIEDPNTAIQVQAERKLLAALGGGCHVPIGCFARIKGEKISIIAMVGDPAGKSFCRQSKEGDKQNFVAVAEELAQELLAEGADRLLGKDG